MKHHWNKMLYKYWHVVKVLRKIVEKIHYKFGHVVNSKNTFTLWNLAVSQLMSDELANSVANSLTLFLPVSGLQNANH